jgi:hypothetical protein
MQHLLADGAVALRVAVAARKPQTASESDENGTAMDGETEHAAAKDHQEEEEDNDEDGSDDDEEESPVQMHVENALTAWQRWCPVALCEQLELRSVCEYGFNEIWFQIDVFTTHKRQNSSQEFQRYENRACTRKSNIESSVSHPHPYFSPRL